ncbi:MAG: ATP-binding cassette domain-containing protein [Isosphaeraceae bacterium]
MDLNKSATLAPITWSDLPRDEACSLSIRGLNYFNGKGENRSQALTEVDLEVGRGEVVILTGPSGSGKTTLLTVIGALRKPDSGDVRVLCHDLTALSGSEAVQFRRQIGFIFQRHNLFNSLTALENVRMATALREESTAEMNRRAMAMLERIGMGERLHHRPSQLSGGQSQRVAIARALVNSPPLVLADEPTASLDAKSGQEVLTILHELADGPVRSTVLIVTHDQRVLDRADRIVNLVGGRIVSNVMPQVSIRIVKTLSRIPRLADYSPTMLAAFADHMFVETFGPRVVVTREGWPGDRAYVIARGKAEEVRAGQPPRELGQGDFFGELGLEPGKMIPSTVTSTEPLEVFVMTRENLRKVMEQDKAIEDRIKISLMNRQ